MFSFRLLVLSLTALLVAPLPLSAETRYVSDRLIITLRSGPATDAPTLTTLESDTPLELLEDLGRFLRVRIPDGREGYVLSQYVLTVPPKTVQLARLERERDELLQTIAKLEQAQTMSVPEREAARKAETAKAAELQQQAEQLGKDLAQANSQVQEVTARYEAMKKASGEVEINLQERERLQEQNDRLTAEIDTLESANESMLRTTMIRWFLAGGGVLLVGWLAGKLSRPKRRGF
jgi:SH3 domain protein